MNDNNESIEPGISKTIFIKYQKETNVIFNTSKEEEEDNLQINIHGINCYFELDFNGSLINQINLDTYTLIINSNNNQITIKPLIDVIEGQYKENYEQKSCPLSINSFFIKNDEDPRLKIENKEENWIHLNFNNYNLLTLIYEIKEVSKDSFLSFPFRINKKSPFSINISYKNDNNLIKTINKNIYDSSYIYLDSSFLYFDNEDYEANNTVTGGILSIKIIPEVKKDINIIFKIIEKNTISLFEKDALTFGFLTSKTTFQYYYTEVFKGEEGELMLHNKRLYGILHGKIINKNDITKDDLNNISIYPKEIINETNTTNITNLYYNPHRLQLNFSYINTSHCFNGCYLLITYEQKQSDNENFPLIGYEFTILSRFWNYTDYISQIVDIPFNEYLLGSFEKGSISHHYYSIEIPDDAEKIIIHIEGNYLDGFYGEGRIRINTVKTIGNAEELKIINNQYELVLNIDSLHYEDKKMSFAFRPKDYYADVYSFYYFRVLYFKKSETVYFPIDSYLGNLCVPKNEDDSNNNKTNKYYCNLILKNNYNYLSIKFSLTSTTQNEYFLINTTKVFTNNNRLEESYQFIYLHTNLTENIDYYLFKMEFQNQEIKNIITSFIDNVEDIYPQIYASQMFYIESSMKNYNFKLINNYILKYQYINGKRGVLKIPLLGYQQFYPSRNFKGKPLAFPIGPGTENIICSSSNENFIYFVQLIYSMRNKGAEELKSGETISNFINHGVFPLYYYLKVKNKNYINVDINLRLISFNDSILQNNFLIRGYVLDEDTIKRKINGEYIQPTQAIEGEYMDEFKAGFLQVNENIVNERNYILIEISSKDKLYFNSYILLEIVTKEYNDNIYFLPVNQYIIETFDGENNEIRTENKYYLSSKEKGDEDAANIEISFSFPDIKVDFDKSARYAGEFANPSGFHRYYSRNAINDDVYFSVKNPNKRNNVYYMIRYYFTGIGHETFYQFDLNPDIEIIDLDNEYVTVTLTFNGVNITNEDYKTLTETYIYFYIYGNLFRKNDSSDEQLNTTCILSERKPSFVNHTKHNYYYEHKEKWKLVYEKIPRKDADIYELQIKANSFFQNNYFNEEFLTYTTKINLTNIKLEEESNYTIIIVIVVIAVVVLCLVIFFIVKYIRLHKSNLNLKEDLKSMAYSNDIQKNVIKKTDDNARTYSDYDSNFI